jgi:hypothetical protein
MPDRSDEFRKAALECLHLARVTSDLSARASLLLMAQRWFDLAHGPESQGRFEAALRVFSEEQMNPKRVTQQQQQIQPKKKG